MKKSAFTVILVNGMQKHQNYRKEMDKVIEETLKQKGRASLLLHACCAPCSSSCLVQIRDFFDITVFYYNPNITDFEEYEKRLAEEKRLIEALNKEMPQDGCYGITDSGKDNTGDNDKDNAGDNNKHNGRDISRGNVAEHEIKFLAGKYEPEKFLDISKGHESDPEGGERCRHCFELRLNESARAAAGGGFDFFTTSLTLSPLKNADLLNEIGRAAGDAAGVRFLPSDFKKKDGYLLSLKLSEKYGLYRQDYCGCAFSRAVRERDKQGKQAI